MNILVICIQRIGDVLLITPLISSLKNAYPNSKIDLLVFQGTEGIIVGNPHVNEVIAFKRKTTRLERMREIRMLWNSYDISISTIPSDRARIYGWAASKRHFGTHSEKDGVFVKKLMFKSVKFNNNNIHTVEMNLKICELLGIEKKFEIIAPISEDQASIDEFNHPYAVIHPYPKFSYKEWEKLEWIKLLNYLIKRKITVYISGGSDLKEIEYCKSLVISDDTISIAGQYSFAEITQIIASAVVFIGIDTSVTHLAAATGVKVIAIYGPTNPIKWGPWPKITNNPNDRVWLRHSTEPQYKSNVILIQGQKKCVPCAEEGCERHVNSKSDCLTSLKSEFIIEEVRKYLQVRSV
jgi:heptosyltransferase-3